VYGLTECAFLLVNGVGRAGVTGKPAPGHALMVVREDGAPSKAGEVGELTVKRTSPTMMLGYLRDGALELPLDAHGWFHSGDLARRNHDGAWTIEGRADDVVKVSGHRVSPKEVEAVLLAHPLVEECAVVGVPDEVRGHALRAVVVAPAKQGLAEELQGWVRTRLAPHLVPREVVVAQELPRTTSGKVRRKDLRA
jgi:acetyl-CoA synthetase